MRRRRPRASGLYTVAALVSAALAGAMGQAALAGARSTAGPARTLPAVVAVAPIARGAPIGAAEVRVEPMLAAALPPGAFSRASQVVGRVALADLAPGEVVTQTRLARVRAGPVASLVPEGLRAFAVPSTLPPGAIGPGDRVDVLATFRGGRVHTETVVSGAEVLLVIESGAGSSAGAGLDVPSVSAGGTPHAVLFLLVSPDQEERLALARALADLQVAIEPAVTAGFPPPDASPTP